MKHLTICIFFVFSLSACDGSKNNRIILSDGNKIAFDDVSTIKEYSATKDDKDRQYYFLAISNDIEATYSDAVKKLGKAGYKPTEKTHSSTLIQTYFKKPYSAMIVANFKRIDGPKPITHTVLSWPLN